MKILNNIFLGKKILIYGLGKSGISSYKFLKNKSNVYLFDDNQKNNLKFKKKIIRYEQIQKINHVKIYYYQNQITLARIRSYGFWNLR